MSKRFRFVVCPASYIENKIQNDFNYITISYDNRYDDQSSNNVCTVHFVDTNLEKRSYAINDDDIKIINGFLTQDDYEFL